MNSGFKFIASTILHNQPNKLLKVREDWFSNTDKEVLDYVRNFYVVNGALPNIKELKIEHGDFDDTSISALPDYYKKQTLKDYVKFRLIEELPKKIKSIRKSDPLELLDEIKAFSNNLVTEEREGLDLVYASSPITRFDEYEEYEGSGGITYLSTGEPFLDEWMHGYSRADLITIAARSGVGKTFFLAFLSVLLDEAIEVTGTDYGSILFISNEMPTKEIAGRLDCMRFGLPYPKFISGKLNSKEKDSYRRGLSKLSSRVIISEPCLEFEQLQHKIKTYRPSIVFLDGSYLMLPGSRKATWEKVGEITSGLKRMALEENIPFINTTQLKRGSGKQQSDFSLDAQEDFAFGGSYINDSDVALPLYQDQEMKLRNEVGIGLAKGRRMDSEFRVGWYFDIHTMETEIYKADGVDIAEVVSVK